MRMAGGIKGWLALAGMLSLSSSVVAEPRERSCEDPLFRQYEASTAERAADGERLLLWQEFLATYPANPCGDEVRRLILELQTGKRNLEERRTTEKWKQEARGGVIEPNLEVFPAHLTLADPAPRDRLRLVNEVLFLTRRGAERSQVQDLILTQVLKLEVAPASRFALSLDFPLVAASQNKEGFGYTLGNSLLGIRGIWGARFAKGVLPFVVSLGLWWSPGNSSWSPAQRAGQNTAAAFAAAHHYPLYRVGQTDYAAHAEAEIGLGRHFLVLALAYHQLVQPDPVFMMPNSEILNKLIGADLAWQIQLLDWLTPSLELNSGIGIASAADFLFLYLAPGVRLNWGRFSSAISVRWPFLDSSQWSRLGVSVELAARL